MSRDEYAKQQAMEEETSPNIRETPENELAQEMSAEDSRFRAYQVLRVENLSHDLKGDQTDPIYNSSALIHQPSLHLLIINPYDMYLYRLRPRWGR